jgi:hypothetical protein
MTHQEGGHDSAGTPWAGRTLPTGDFAGDDGAPDAGLVSALGQVRMGFADDRVVIAALAAARLFVPVVAVLGEQGETVHGVSDKQADMALVTLTGPEGRRALPVFSSLDALAAWNPQARPVPVQARRAAISAVAEECQLMVLDPAGPTTYVVSRSAMWAVGAGRPWTPAHVDPEVVAEVGVAVAGLPDVVTFRTEPGVEVQLTVVLVLRPGMVPEQVQAVAGDVGARLQASDLVRERVDGIALRVSRD